MRAETVSSRSTSISTEIMVPCHPQRPSHHGGSTWDVGLQASENLPDAQRDIHAEQDAHARLVLNAVSDERVELEFLAYGTTRDLGKAYEKMENAQLTRVRGMQEKLVDGAGNAPGDVLHPAELADGPRMPQRNLMNNYWDVSWQADLRHRNPFAGVESSAQSRPLLPDVDDEDSPRRMWEVAGLAQGVLPADRSERLISLNPLV